jgi:hypothetical protein
MQAGLQVSYILVLYILCLDLAWSDFPTGGGAPGLSFDVLLHPCLHHVIVMNSEAAACMMSQTMCTAGHNIPSLH